MRLLILTIALLVTAFNAYSIDRPIQEDKPELKAPAPSNVYATYEGGIAGHEKKVEGTLHFDDTKSCIIFRNRFGKDLISIPYNIVKATYADTHLRTGSIVKKVGPVPYFGAWYMKKDKKYLTIHYQTNDSSTTNLASFRIPDKRLLADTIAALGDRANLEPYGQTFIRPEYAKSSKQEEIRASLSPDTNIQNLNGQAIKRVKPKYPKEARKRHAVGLVDVQINIDETGRVTKAEAISGDPLLHQAAVKAAYGWRFKPTFVEGKPVEVPGLISFSFSLKD
jgi:TonB family protein